MKNNKNTIFDTLKTTFDAKRTNSIDTYFQKSIQKLKEGNWEVSLSNSGKFIEEVIKTLWTYAGKTLPKERDFHVGSYADKIIKIDSSVFPNDELRIQIPRACIFVYDIASNRGCRHVSDKFNPNEMDAVTCSAICSWILAELIRYCYHESISPDEARKLINSIIERKYPIFEEIDGRIWVDNTSDKKYRSAVELALMILYRKFPSRMSKKTLTETIIRHGYKNTAFKVKRLSKFVDEDRHNKLKLRTTGMKKVEQILKR